MHAQVSAAAGEVTLRGQRRAGQGGAGRARSACGGVAHGPVASPSACACACARHRGGAGAARARRVWHARMREPQAGARGLGRRGGGEWRAQERGRRPGYGAAPRREGREREGPAGVHDREGEREEKKEKEKKMEKRNGGRKREGERGIRAGITALIAEPVGHAWRPGARERDARVRGKTGMGPREIWMSARFLGVSGNQAGDDSRRGSSSTTKQKILAHDLF